MDSHYCNILSVAMNRGRAGKTPACRVQHGMWPVVLSWMVSGSHPDGDDDVDRCAATKKARIMVAEVHFETSTASVRSAAQPAPCQVKSRHGLDRVERLGERENRRAGP